MWGGVLCVCVGGVGLGGGRRGGVLCAWGTQGVRAGVSQVGWDSSGLAAGGRDVVRVGARVVAVWVGRTGHTGRESRSQPGGVGQQP